MADKSPDFASLRKRATQLRCDVVEMIARAGSDHNGGSLSAADMLAYLYFHQMRIDPERPDWPDRDRFVLSKGHCCPICQNRASIGMKSPISRRYLCRAGRRQYDGLCREAD